MIGLGIVIHFPRTGRPAGACVVATAGATGDPQLVHTFELPSEDIDRPSQLHALGQAIRSRVESLGIDAVWIRTAEETARIGRHAGPRIRLQAEGAVALAARERIASVHLGDGLTIGQLLGVSKADADAQGAALIGPHARKPDAEAAAAAIAALQTLGSP